MADTDKKKMYYDDFVKFMRSFLGKLDERYAFKDGDVGINVTDEWIKSLFDEAVTKEKVNG